MNSIELSKRKIVHISAWARKFTQFSLPLIKKLDEVFETQIIYCPEDDEHVGKLRREGLVVRNGEVNSRIEFAIFHQIIKLYRFLKKEKCDICVAHQPMGALIGLPAAYLARIPIKIYQTGGLKYSPDVKGYTNLLYKYGEFFVMNIADAVLTVNMEDYKYLQNNKSLISKAYYVGPRDGCGVDTKQFSPETRRKYRCEVRIELGIPENTTVIGYTGRVVWEKGFKEIIESAKTLQRMRLNHVFVIVGEGPDLDDVRAQITAGSLNNHFIFLGYTFRINYFMSAFDQFILPSYREGLPVSLLEAMAMGIPCIGTNIRGTRQLISDNRTGLLIPAKNAEALAEAIYRFASSKSYADCVANEASKDIASKYSEELMVEETLRIFLNLTNGRSESH